MDKIKTKQKVLNYINKNYDLNDEKIKHKYYHSIEVAKYAFEIAESLSFSKEEKNLSFILGLLHDIGRFEQYKLYNNYEDHKSVDHGDLAVKLLFDKGLINLFDIPKKYHQILYFAIREHNKKNIDSSIKDKKILVYCRLVRDADKIDLFRLSINNGFELFYGKKEGVNQRIYNSILNGECGDTNLVETTLDLALLSLGTIYDLYYDYSLNKIKDFDYFNKLKRNFSEILNKKDNFRLAKAVSRVETFFNSRLLF